MSMNGGNLSQRIKDKDEIGAKARNLLRLKEVGFRVPKFFALDRITLQESSYFAEIEKKFPHTKYFAVRSSAHIEDAEGKSYAGFFRTSLGVTSTELKKEVERVHASYGTAHGGVIVQEFIPSDKAGVVFTRVEGEYMVINANFGLCESVVKGFSCDEYVIERETKKVVQKRISAVKSCLFFTDGKIKEQKKSGESLTKREIFLIIQTAEKIESALESPQDIEWCMAGEKLYILQSRPITRALKLFDNKIYYDSANIAESYSGIVLPLTFSFARHLYSRVYVDLLRASGVPKKILQKHGEVFKNLLAYFSGRMYYNMNNWYAMTSLVPGYRRNKENLEAMISSNIFAETKKVSHPTLWLFIKYPFLVFFKMLFFSSTLARFKKVTQAEIRHLQNTDMRTLPFVECKNFYEKIEKKLLSRWFRTLENDFLVMTYYGLARKVLTPEELREAMRFESKGTLQLRTLRTLAHTLARTAPLWREIEEEDEISFQKALRKYPDIEAGIHEYFREFGGRFANELKLESSSLEDDFKKFSQLMRLYAREYDASREKKQRLKKQIIFLKRYIGKKFIFYSQEREEMRLLRSSAFSLARKIFNRIGEIFSEEGKISKKEDIYYLRVEEIFGNDPTEPQLLAESIEKRKIEFSRYFHIELPSHFSLGKGEQPREICRGEIERPLFLHGNSCTEGKISGRVKVMRDFTMPQVLDFEILVAEHTDPGWTALIALSQGLIVEYGGMLSHASIVARELGIPTILGVKDATKILRDGQRVELNATQGIVTLLS